MSIGDSRVVEFSSYGDDSNGPLSHSSPCVADRWVGSRVPNERSRVSG
jgi:hypothetical protein